MAESEQEVRRAPGETRQVWRAFMSSGRKRLRKLVLIVALAVVGAVFAPSAFAAQPMTISNVDDWGFTATAPSGWNVRNCTGAAYDSGNGVIDTASLWDKYGRIADLTWNGYPDVATIDRVEVDCDLKKTTVTYPKKWRWFTKARTGTDTSSRSKSGNCYFSGFSGDLWVDCWGSGYATAKYRFGLPSDARQISRRIRGTVGCCDGGRVTRSWSDNRATVTVTGWRSYTVERVSIHYQHKAPTRTVTTYYATGHGERTL
jgi:hypothetical protein